MGTVPADLAAKRLQVSQDDWDAGCALLARRGIRGQQGEQLLHRFLERISPWGMWQAGILSWPEAAELTVDFPGWPEEARRMRAELAGMGPGERADFLLHAYGPDCLAVVVVLLYP